MERIGIGMLFPACIVDGNGGLYYVTHGTHVIKRLDLETKKNEYIDNPNGYVQTEWKGVDKLLFDDNRLYLFEQNGRRVLEYTLTEKTSRCFDVECNVHGWDNYCLCTFYGNSIFIFPSFLNNVIKIDLKSGEINGDQKLLSNIEYIFELESSIVISDGKEVRIPHKLYSCGYQISNDVWLFTERKQLILKYDLFTEECIEYILPNEIKGCIHAIWKEGLFYILSIEGSVYSWNYLNNKVELIFYSKDKYGYPYFDRIAVTDKNIWIIPCFGRDIYIIDLINKNKKIYLKYPKDFNYKTDPKRSKYNGYCEDLQNYYFAMHSANYLLIINKKDGKEKWLSPIEPAWKEVIDYYNRYPIGKYDELDIGLERFFLLGNQCSNVLCNTRMNLIGKSVWDYCK